MNRLASLAGDFRYSLRLLARNPGFASVAVLTLALGIGANSAVFSLVDAVLLRPLAYPEPERLVWLWESNPAQNLPVVAASPANFADWREQSRSFEILAAWRDVNLTLTGVEIPERVAGARVFPELLAVLGARPALGRGFARGEGGPTGERVAMVTHGLWQRRFGGDANLVGRVIQLDGVGHVVIGILGPEFRFPRGRIEILAPWTPSPADMAERGAKFRYLRVLARLKPGVSAGQAQVEMNAIARRLEDAYPASNRGWSVLVMPLREFFVADFRAALAALAAAVGLVVLVACVNVANLLLARATSRRKEIAVRAALGAGGGRLVRQLLAESVVLGLAGGLAGLVVAGASLKLLLSLIPEMNIPIPGLDSVRIDPRVGGYTLALSVLMGVLFGLAPVAQARAAGLHEALKEGGRGGTGGARGGRIRALLVVSEVALAVVLSIGAGLVTKSFRRLQRVDLGFNSGNALAFRVSLPPDRYGRPAAQRAFFRRLEERFKALAGVVDVGLTSYVPLGGFSGMVLFSVDGRPGSGEGTPAAGNQVVTPSYFRTMGIRLAAGRFFTEQDDENAPRVAIVNQALARRYLAGMNPLGQALHLDGERPDTPPLVVVGVVGDVRQLQLYQEPTPELYRCYYQAPTASMSAVVRTVTQASALGATARREVAALDPNQPIYSVETLQELVQGSAWETRLMAALFGAFSALALVLAAVGIYGLTSYAVAARRREFGLRMALGAAPGQVLRLVLARGLALAVAGVAGGMVVAYFFARAMAGLLYGTQAVDPEVFFAVPALLLAVASGANLAPALRAAAVDPATAVRHE
jgi:putative ABC transport system permease protein